MPHSTCTDQVQFAKLQPLLLLDSVISDLALASILDIPLERSDPFTVHTFHFTISSPSDMSISLLTYRALLVQAFCSNS